ncbi:hypothetical protein [Agromyces intestinalis]|nr:hypothetical protein [Agromyces intestinalis]
MLYPASLLIIVWFVLLAVFGDRPDATGPRGVDDAARADEPIRA